MSEEVPRINPRGAVQVLPRLRPPKIDYLLSKFASSRIASPVLSLILQNSIISSVTILLVECFWRKVRKKRFSHNFWVLIHLELVESLLNRTAHLFLLQTAFSGNILSCSERTHRITVDVQTQPESPFTTIWITPQSYGLPTLAYPQKTVLTFLILLFQRICFHNVLQTKSLQSVIVLAETQNTILKVWVWTYTNG